MIDRVKLFNELAEKFPDNVGDDFRDDDLGGCAIKNDFGTYYPKMWGFLVEQLGVKSVLDVGCGFGYSLDFFVNNLNLDGLGIEGSEKVANASPLKDIIKIHDYRNGNVEINREFDLCWCCEVVEHIERKDLDALLSTFTKAKYVCMTFAEPDQSGHHHVNCQPGEYWVGKCYEKGLFVDIPFTQSLREKAREDYEDFQNSEMEDKQSFVIPHFVTRGIFFNRINPESIKGSDILF